MGTPAADKSIAGSELHRTRSRAVYAFSAPANWMTTYTIKGCLDWWLEFFSDTYLTRGPTDYSEFMEGRELVKLDYSQFDWWVPAVAKDEFLAAASARFPDWWVIHNERLWHGAIFSPATGDGPENGPLWAGHPHELNGEFTYGLGSGHAFNVPLGRLYGSFLQLVILEDALQIPLESWMSSLKGEARVKLKN